MEPAINGLVTAAIFIPFKPSAWDVVAVGIIGAAIVRVVSTHQTSTPAWLHALNAGAAGIAVLQQSIFQATLIAITAAVVVGVAASHENEHKG